jgi:hypothetical protein
MDGVIGEKGLELREKLGSKCFVVGDYERRPLELGNNIGHGKGLTRARYAKQNLIAYTPPGIPHQLFNSPRLIPSGFVFFDKVKFIHLKTLTV